MMMRNGKFFSTRLTTALLSLALALTWIPYPLAYGAAASAPAPESVSEFALGYVPVETQLVYPDLDEIASLLDLNETVPSSYDLRDYGLLTPIRNQGSNGICWTFSCYSTVESNLLKNGYPEEDLSEVHMAHATSSYSGNSAEGWDRDPGGGGNLHYAASYLMRGTGLNGAVREEDDPYGDAFTPLQARDLSVTRSKPKSYAVRNFLFMNDETKPTPKMALAIKQAVMTYGAIAASMYWDGTAVAGYGNSAATYYNENTASYYYNGRAMFTQNQLNANHAVAIVGWDDDYPAQNFNANCRPSANGAWLVRNSWGEDWGDGGYVWISYEDTNFPLDVCFADGVVPFDPAVHVYESDYKTDVTAFPSYFRNATETYARAFIVEQEGEQLQSVKVFLPNGSCKAEIDAIPSFAADSFSGYRFTPQASVSATWPGWYTIDFPSLVPLGAQGSRFAIVVRVTSASGGSASIGVDMSASAPRNTAAYRMNERGKFESTFFNISAKAVATTNTAENAVNKAKADLTWDFIRGENVRQDAVEWGLSLPLSLHGAAIEWTSAPSGVIGQDGTIAAPDADTAVTLTAEISYGGVSDTVAFQLTVKGVSPADRQAVADAADALTWEVIKGDNASASEVKSALSLPTNFQGASVSWHSSNEQIVAADGAVNRPEEESESAAVTLKASLRYGTAAADKTFSLTVLPKSQVDDPRLDSEMSLYDWYGAWEKVRGDNPAGYFGWENIRANLVVPAPQYVDKITLQPTQSDADAEEYEPWDCIAEDGTVTRPAFGNPDSVGSLIIWFWLEGEDEPSDGYLYGGYQVLAYRGDIQIIRQPEDISVSADRISGFLRADAAQGSGDAGAIGALSYQWYLDEDDTPGGGVPVSGADSSTFYLPSDLREGVSYYYCEIAAPDAASVLTQNAAVTVVRASERQTVSVFFDSAGGSAVASQSVEIGESATEPETPVRDGYLFMEWRLNGEPYDFSAPVTEDITLEAIWEPSEESWTDDSQILWTAMYRIPNLEVCASVSSSTADFVWCVLYDSDGKMTDYSFQPFDGSKDYVFSFEGADCNAVKVILLDDAFRPLCECGQARDNGWPEDDDDRDDDADGRDDDNRGDDNGGQDGDDWGNDNGGQDDDDWGNDNGGQDGDDWWNDIWRDWWNWWNSRWWRNIW